MATTQIKDGFQGGSDNQLKVNADGSINTTGGSGSNASVGSTGTTAPTSATELGGINPSGNLEGLLVDVNGALIVTTTPSGTQTITGTVSTNQNPLSNFKTTQYTIGLTAIQLTPTPLTNRSSISLRVSATNGAAIFIAPTNAVTITNGYPLFDGDTLQMDLGTTNTLYAVSDTVNQTVAVLEIA